MNAFKSINFKNHPVLGNLTLDFCDNKGAIAKTVIFAGENGSGKSKILEALYKCATGHQYFGGEIEFTTQLGNSEVVHKKTFNEENDYGHRYFDEEGVGISIEDDEIFPVIFSEVNFNFDTKPIDSAKNVNKNTDIDIDVVNISRRFNSDYAVQIKQLLVDITNQDALDLLENCRKAKAENRSLDDIKIGERLERFTTAFDAMFDNLTFSAIKNTGTGIDVLFKKKKMENEISIDNLSSGEKQIVYRACFLLQDKTALQGPMVLIDEPELSMHPKWQQKIFQYYRGLFTQDGEQTSQMFFATHSEYVIKAALESKDRDNILVIALSNKDGTIVADRITPKIISENSVFNPTTSVEANYLVFDVISNDYHNQLYAHIKTTKGFKGLYECDEYIAKSVHYDKEEHERYDNTYNETEYNTLPTFIRNATAHPESKREFNDADLRKSIALLRNICFDLRTEKK